MDPAPDNPPTPPERPAASDRPERPDSIGPFRILGELGQGGMGEVYLAEQSEPVRRRVALKVVKLGMDSAEVVARFEAERQALAILDHPCVAKVFDGGLSEGGRPYFVMELVDGPPITEYCEAHGLDIDARLQLFVQVCAAIQHAHQKGVIHRDIKPSNVLVATSDGVPMPKVIDFGVAKATASRLSEKSVHTAIGQLVGTVEYMSPEQVELKEVDVDTRADIYSLGVLLYELLTGTLPFEAPVLRTAGLGEIRRIICEEDPARPSTRVARMGAAGDSTTSLGTDGVNALARRLRGELDWIVMKALEKDRSRRYPSAEELRRDVRSYLSGTGVAARPPSAAYQLRVFARRNRALVTGASAVFLALLVGAFVSFRLYLAEQAARADEAHQRELAVEASLAEGLARERAEALAREAEAQRVAAERQARIAASVNDFLNRDLLGAASPDHAGGGYDPDVRVSELLERAGRAVDGGAIEDPLVEAAVRKSLGSAYRALGRFDPALREMRRALELTERGAPSALSAEASKRERLVLRAEIGGLHYDNGDYVQARELLEPVRGELAGAFGASDPDTLRATSSLGFVAMADGREAEGEALLTQALEGARQVNDGNGATAREAELLPTLAANLGRLYLTQKRLEEAVPLFREAIAGYERARGADHPATVMTIGNLAALYNSMRSYLEARPLLERVLETQRRVLGDDHPDTLTTLNNYAFNLDNVGELSEAEALYREVLERRIEVLGADHPHVLSSMSNLGNVYRKQGRLGESADALAESLAVHLEVLGPDHRDTQYARLDLSTTLRAMGRTAEAAELLGDAAVGSRIGMAHDASFTVGCLMRRGKYLRELGRHDEGVASLLEAAELGERELGIDHSFASSAVRALVAAYRDLGDEQAAEAWEARIP